MCGLQELSILCDCQVAIVIFNQHDKLFEYASESGTHTTRPRCGSVDLALTASSFRRRQRL